MSALAPEDRSGARTAPAVTTTLDVVVPVYNEEADLAASVTRLRRHLLTLPWSFRITIADNASTDGTAVAARRLAHTWDEVEVVHLAEKGRGRALKRAWTRSTSDVLVYMDVDLSTDLNALLPLVAPLISGHSDLAIGTRLQHGSRVTRGPKREVISRGYNLLVKGALRTRFSDAQCGFKAIRADVAREVLPLVEDDAWFFDTELLVLAERAGLRIHEVPVDWVDDPDSRVDLARTAYDDLRGLARLGRNLLAGRIPVAEVSERLGRASADAGGGRLGLQIGLFALVGVVSTVAYAVLYLLLRGRRRPAVGQRDRAAGDRDRQHRGQPSLHLRRPRSHRRAAAPGPGPAGLPGRARRHQRRPVAAAQRRRRPPRARGRGADRRQPRGHRDAVRGAAGVGLRPAEVTASGRPPRAHLGRPPRRSIAGKWPWSRPGTGPFGDN